MNWTGPLVQAWIKQQFNVEYTERGVRALLYRLDLRWTQPTYVLAKADPLKQQAFVLEFDELKQGFRKGNKNASPPTANIGELNCWDSWTMPAERWWSCNPQRSTTPRSF